MNIESHSLKEALDPSAWHALGIELPASAMPSKSFAGVGRLIVPTVRTTAEKGAPLPIRALLLAKEACSGVTITYKPMGEETTANMHLSHVIDLSICTSTADDHDTVTMLPVCCLPAGAASADASATVALKNLGRQVYEGAIPAAATAADFEYLPTILHPLNTHLKRKHLAICDD